MFSKDERVIRAQSDPQIQYVDVAYIDHDLAYPYLISQLDSLPKSFEQFPLDSYFLIKSDLGPELYYLEPNKNITKLNLDEVSNLKNVLAGISSKELSELDKKNIRNEITLYRIKNNIPRILMKINLHNQVGVASYALGNFLFSKNFKPCQAVVAYLNDNQFAVYHAFVDDDSVEGFLGFVNSIKGKASEVYVFQKKLNQSNMDKAPHLAINLAKHLDMEVRRIHLNDYEHIIVDAVSNKIVLSNKIITFSKQTNTIELGPVTNIDIDSSSIPIIKSIEELFEQKDSMPAKKGNYFKISTTTIPENMIPLEIQNKWSKKIQNQLFALLNKDPENEKKMKKLNKEIKELIKHGADVNAIDSDNSTLLVKALVKKNRGLMELLIKYGADVKQAYQLAQEKNIDTSLLEKLGKDQRFFNQSLGKSLSNESAKINIPSPR